MAALDCGTLPLLMLGQRARIVHANRAGTALLAAGRVFSAAGGRLHVQRQDDQEAIEGALASVIVGGLRGAPAQGERAVVHLLNRQGDVNHVLTLSPLPGSNLALAAIAELRAPVPLGRNWSREALALPAAYAELAEALASGENLSEFAERTGLTIGGARTRLKKLLKRLGTRSQSDLVGVLLRAASTLSVR